MIDTAGPKAPAAARLLPRPDRPALVRGTIIVVLLLLALFALPPLMNGYYTDTMTQVAIYSIVTLGLGLLVGRVGLYSLGQIAVLIIGAWTAARLLFGTGQPFILVMIEAGLVTMIIGSRDHAAGAAAARPVPGADHADAGRRRHRHRGHAELPERRRRLLRVQRLVRAHPADPQAVVRRHRPGVLPVLRDRRDRHVPARLRAPAGQAGPRVGLDQAVRGRLARGGHQHHVLQALGDGAGVVRHRGGGRAARGRGPLPVLDRLPDPELDHPAGRGADGRRVQPGGRCHRRVLAGLPSRDALSAVGGAL